MSARLSAMTSVTNPPHRFVLRFASACCQTRQCSTHEQDPGPQDLRRGHNTTRHDTTRQWRHDAVMWEGTREEEMRSFETTSVYDETFWPRMGSRQGGIMRSRLCHFTVHRLVYYNNNEWYWTT